MYSRVINILDEYFQDRWFLDSGSLLGIVRDGNFLPSDVGIDISVIIDNHNDPKLEECIKKLTKEGLVVSRFQIYGKTYKYDLVPKQSCKLPFAFDLHLFKLSGNDYLCPNVKMRQKCSNKIATLMMLLRLGGIIKLEKGIVGFFERIFIFLYRDVFEYFGEPCNFSKGLKDEHIYKWVIPSEMIHGVQREKLYGFNILYDCDEYLTYRYGNWHVPVSDWVTIRDDGGFKKSNIKEMTEFMEK